MHQEHLRRKVALAHEIVNFVAFEAELPHGAQYPCSKPGPDALFPQIGRHAEWLEIGKRASSFPFTASSALLSPQEFSYCGDRGAPSFLKLPGWDVGKIEDALRNAVEKKYRSNPDQLTVKRIRTDVEQQLGLDDGFFKADAIWNTRSKEDAQEAKSQPPSSQPAKPSPPKHRIQAGKNDKNSNVLNSKKRSSADREAPKKRQKKDYTTRGNPANKIRESLEQDLTMPEPRRSTSSGVLSEVDGEEAEPTAGADRAERATNGAEDHGSESEMSVLLDEDPKPTKRARKVSSEKPKPKKKQGSKPIKAPQLSADLDTEEIKRLQGWLVKCGIRKMWFKELAPHNTPKAKIRHLKDMLTEAGMTGRYSQEKATQIREARELKADLDAVQAGNKQWGKAESDEDAGSRPKRELARGLQELDFLKDDDSEDEENAYAMPLKDHDHEQERRTDWIGVRP
ncbi:MAG: hypothetical protein Q9166_000738 [cf. Caloplaca sp. 2 TL-2023]